MRIVMALLILIVVAVGGFYLLGTDINVQDEGEMPDVDVSVDAEEGELPDVDADTPDVNVREETAEVEVPEVNVETEEETVDYPNVDVDAAEGSALDDSADQRRRNNY